MIRHNITDACTHIYTQTSMHMYMILPRCNLASLNPMPPELRVAVRGCHLQADIMLFKGQFFTCSSGSSCCARHKL